QRLARDLDQDHRAIGHGDGAFRKLQARRDFLVRRRHDRSLPYLPLKAGLRLARKAATPSLKSSLRPSSRWKSRSTSSCAPRALPLARFIASLLRARGAVPLARYMSPSIRASSFVAPKTSRRASSVAVFMSSSSSTTSQIRPHS